MEFKFRAVDDRPPYLSSSPSMINYFTEQALRAGCSNNGIRLNELLSNPSDMREAIQRELEKELIREEIIAREIARRRILEAEVRRELLMEQELMLTKTEFKSPVSPAIRLDRFPLFHQSDSRALEERLSRSLAQRLALQARHEMLAALETGTSFQRGVEAAGPEVKPFPEVNKDRVILLPKPGQNLSGAKRKATTPPTVGVNELSSVGSKKKLKEEWSCALCQVTATSERGLNEHLQGKKHKAKEAGLVAQRAGKNPAPLQKKFRKASKLAEITDAPGTEQVEKIVGETLQTDIVGEASMSILKKHNAEDGEKKNEVGEDMTKNVEATKPKGQKPVDPKLKKKKFKFWCELCHVGAYCEVVMSTHKKGKKHVARLQEISQHDLPVPISSTTMTPSPEVIQNTEAAEVIAKEVNAEVIAVEADEKPLENNEANEDGSGPSSSVK
ncbi:hypothetical protein PVL29_014591 [Vitis rotundifolia]|uniref:U1-type domain-containing protein n=1 Tax=Vitis rotundifolia TaxID=103349 RepID=A0AA39DMK5_VITRO|nr:hypothetical protein PVL29_014591 [Vitis rotundifolia]